MSWWTDILLTVSILEDVGNSDNPDQYVAVDRINEWLFENAGRSQLFLIKNAERHCPSSCFAGSFKVLPWDDFIDCVKHASTIGEFQAIIDRARVVISHAESTIRQSRADIERARTGILRLSKGLPKPSLSVFDGYWICTCPKCGWSKQASIQIGHTGLELAYANHSHETHIG